MTSYNTSNYHQRKAQRLAQTPAQWVQNPETQEWFFLRPVGAMASLVAGMMPASLTGYAIGQWKEAGLDVGAAGEDDDLAQSIEDSQREFKMMASVVARSCVIPLLTKKGQQRPAQYDPAWINLVCNALAGKYDDFKREAFTPESIMLDAEDLDDSDVLFIIRFATGQTGKIQLAGGQAMNVADLKSVPKKLNRGPGTSAAKQKLRNTA